MKTKVLLFIIFFLPINAFALTNSERKVGDRLYDKMVSSKYEHIDFVPKLKKLKNIKAYSKYSDIFDYVILKLEEDKNILNEELFEDINSVQNKEVPEINRNCNKKFCKYMTSCEEAYYHLNTCGYSKLDRDNDGIPCENVCKK